MFWGTGNETIEETTANAQTSLHICPHAVTQAEGQVPMILVANTKQYQLRKKSHQQGLYYSSWDPFFTEESPCSSLQACPLALVIVLTSPETRMQNKGRRKKWRREGHAAGDKFPSPATSQRQGPGLIFYKTSGKITSPAQPCLWGRCGSHN